MKRKPDLESATAVKGKLVVSGRKYPADRYQGRFQSDEQAPRRPAVGLPAVVPLAAVRCGAPQRIICAVSRINVTGPSLQSRTCMTAWN